MLDGLELVENLSCQTVLDSDVRRGRQWRVIRRRVVRRLDDLDRLTRVATHRELDGLSSLIRLHVSWQTAWPLRPMHLVYVSLHGLHSGRIKTVHAGGWRAIVVSFAAAYTLLRLRVTALVVGLRSSGGVARRRGEHPCSESRRIGNLDTGARGAFTSPRERIGILRLRRGERGIGTLSENEGLSGWI